MEPHPLEPLACPLPPEEGDTVLLGHGGGGLLGRRLIERLIVPTLGSAPGGLLDAAILPAGDDPGGTDRGAGRLAFTTDSYVVRPLFFPGGDIGRLAVYGTVNDLAMVGAVPTALSLALILEEGLAIAILRRVLASVRQAAERCGVAVVTGDTKVVERGKGDGLFLTSTGVGRIAPGLAIGPAAIRQGDTIVVSGDLGRHGIAVLAARAELGFRTALESDLAPLHEPVQALLAAGIRPHALRDLTRGGLTAALHELAQDSGLGAVIREAEMPLEPAVEAACELLGLDPLGLANEGRFVLYLDPRQAGEAVAILRRFQPSARPIGQVEGRGLRLETALGVRRPLEPGRGETLPRIC